MKALTWKKALAPTLASCLPSTKSLLQVQKFNYMISKSSSILCLSSQVIKIIVKKPVQENLSLHLIAAHETKLATPVGHLTLNHLSRGILLSHKSVGIVGTCTPGLTSKGLIACASSWEGLIILDVRNFSKVFIIIGD